MAFGVLSTRKFAEGFVSIWAAIMLVALSVGGTMIMRKFHNSIAVGFFMGCVCAMAQFFFLLFCIYLGYASDRRQSELPAREERLMALLSLIQSILLASFASILGAHRSEILDRNMNIQTQFSTDMSVGSATSGDGSVPYNPPNAIP